MALWNSCQHRTIWEWKFQNATPPAIFIWCEPNFMRTLATMNTGYYFSFKYFVPLLTWESVGKPKMWNISKTADRRVKWPNIWESGFYSADMYSTFHAPFFEFGLNLVWGHSGHFAKFPILRFSRHYSFNSLHQNSTKRHTKYYNLGLIWAITFWWSAKNYKMMTLWICFLTQDHMELEI